MGTKVTPINSAIQYVTIQEAEGVVSVVVDCEDFSAYKKLPAGVNVTYDGNDYECGLTGWNSDQHQAYYQSNRAPVRAIYNRKAATV